MLTHSPFSLGHKATAAIEHSDYQSRQLVAALKMLAIEISRDGRREQKYGPLEYAAAPMALIDATGSEPKARLES